jgi:hypothetical protein
MTPSRRPSEHVSRVRRKLPGQHNRRYKGKSKSHDRSRSVLEGYRAALVQLPGAVQDDFGLLTGIVSMELLWLAAQVLRDVDAPETVIVYAEGDVVFADFGARILQLRIQNGRWEARILGAEALAGFQWGYLNDMQKLIYREVQYEDEWTDKVSHDKKMQNMPS